jgi:hypothetical protein
MRDVNVDVHHRQNRSTLSVNAHRVGQAEQMGIISDAAAPLAAASGGGPSERSFNARGFTIGHPRNIETPGE